MMGFSNEWVWVNDNRWAITIICIAITNQMWFPKCFSKHWEPHHWYTIWVLGNDLNMVTSQMLCHQSLFQDMFSNAKIVMTLSWKPHHYFIRRFEDSTPFRNKRQSTTKTRRTRRCHVNCGWFIIPGFQWILWWNKSIKSWKKSINDMKNDLKSTENLCIVISCDRRIWCLVKNFLHFWTGHAADQPRHRRHWIQQGFIRGLAAAVNL